MAEADPKFLELDRWDMMFDFKAVFTDSGRYQNGQKLSFKSPMNFLCRSDFRDVFTSFCKC